MYKLLVSLAIVAFSTLLISKLLKYKNLPEFGEKLHKAIRRLFGVLKYLLILGVGSILLVVNFSFVKDFFESILTPATISVCRDMLQFVFGSASVMAALQNMMVGALFALGSFSALAFVLTIYVHTCLNVEDVSSTQNYDKYSNFFYILNLSEQKCYRAFSRYLI